jgi:hypothetical protein
VKTIVFSELPKNEKIKYFNFLLENDINFTRDENGYYVALVKVLNPAYYGENNQNQTQGNKTATSGFNFSKGFEKVGEDTNNTNNTPNNIPKPRSTSQTGPNRSTTKNTPMKDTRSKSPIGGAKFEKTTNQNFKVKFLNIKINLQHFRHHYKHTTKCSMRNTVNFSRH